MSLFKGKNKIIILGIIIFIFVTSMFIIGYNIKIRSKVTIDCPKEVKIGQVVECKINAKINNDKILSINANYNFEEAEYSEFISNSMWTTFASSKNGFAVGNVNGTSGTSFVGTLKYIILDSYKSDSYKMTLKNIEYSDSNYKMHKVKDTSVTIKIIK